MTIVFLDCETTSLEPREAREPWEIALIVEGHANGAFDGEWRWFVQPEHLEEADPNSLRFARYYERTALVEWTSRAPAVCMAEPQGDGRQRDYSERGYPDAPKPTATRSSHADLARLLALLLAGAHLVGAVPGFDEDTLRRYLRRHGQQLTNHYHLIDVESAAVGYFAGRVAVERAGLDVDAVPEVPLTPPWDSDKIWDALGVQIPADQRHTALGDARQVRAAWRVITGQDPLA